MTPTPIALLEKAAQLGLKLGREGRRHPNRRTARALPAGLRRHTERTQVASSRVEAGADEWSIYTRDELRILVTENRIAPFSDAELRKVHQMKRTFGGTIVE
jgi:hypothetical protein